MKPIVAALACVLLAGCVATPAQRTVPVEVIEAGPYCGQPDTKEASVTVFDAQAEWDGFNARRVSREFGALRIAPAIDFAAHRVVLIDMGVRPIGGYAVELADPGAMVEGNTLELVVDWREPEPGGIYTQGLTYPCLLVAVPRTGYEGIVVRSRDGRVIGGPEP